MRLTKSTRMAFLCVLYACTMVTAEELPKELPAEKRAIADIWKVGEVLDYVFTINQIEVGHQWNKLVGIEKEKEQEVHRFEQRVSLDLSKVGQPVRIEHRAILIVESDGSPLNYDLEGTVNDQEVNIKLRFEGEIADVVTSVGDNVIHKKIPCPKDVFLLDQNVIGDLNLLLGVSDDLQVGSKVSRSLFIPQALVIVPTIVEITGKEKYVFGGKSIDVYLGNVMPLKWMIWVSEDTRLLEIQDTAQGLVVQLKAPAE